MWKKICDEYETPVHNLSYIVRYNVVNRITKRLLRELVAQDQLDKDHYWTYTPEDEWFYAILQTPNAVGAAYLL